MIYLKYSCMERTMLLLVFIKPRHAVQNTVQRMCSVQSV